MATKFSTAFLTETDYPIWNQLVAASPLGSIYSTPEYLDILCSVTDARYRILGVFRNDELIGGVGLYERKSPAGTTVSNRLLLYFNGLVMKESAAQVPSLRTAQHIEALTAIERAIAGLPYARVRLHSRYALTDVRPFVVRGWVARPSYTYEVSVLDLAQQWNLVEHNLRRLVLRCGNAGITVSDDDDFDSFFELHYQTHLRKGAPLYLPKGPFGEYVRRLRAMNFCRLYHARNGDGRALATQLVLLGNHPVSHTVTAAADAEFLNLGTTPYLRWKAFESLNALGYAANDLTDAALNSVTHFKSQLGGKLRTTTVLNRGDSRALKMYESVSGILARGRAVAGRIVRYRRGKGEG
jgi:hypothetical protein